MAPFARIFFSGVSGPTEPNQTLPFFDATIVDGSVVRGSEKRRQNAVFRNILVAADGPDDGLITV